jgi:hypothetical protein
MKRKRIRLTEAEIEALLAAAGNIDPCMFTEDTGGKEGERLYDAWESGQQKLREMLANVEKKRAVRAEKVELHTAAE